MTREAVINAILGAKTVTDVEKAREMRDIWITLHPYDFGVLDIGRSLEKMAEIAGLPPLDPNRRKPKIERSEPETQS